MRRLLPVAILALALPGPVAWGQDQEGDQITWTILFRVARDMAQCSGAYRATAEVIGGPEGGALGDLADGFERSSGLVASLVTNDREQARRITVDRVDAFARAWAVRARRALGGDGIDTYHSKMDGLGDKYATLNGELVDGSLQLGHAGNDDADAWSSMVTEALVRFMQTPEGTALVREVGE